MHAPSLTYSRDGALYTATPLDPLFLLLPRLEKLRNRNKSEKTPNGSYVPMKELYMDLEQPNYTHLRDLKGVDLELLCDVEGQSARIPC